MKKLLGFVLILICCSAFADEARPEVSRYTRAYSGDEGLQVYVTRIGPAEKGEVLIMVSGVDHPLDGVVRKGRVESSERQRRYTVGKEKDAVVMILEGSSGNVYLPWLPNNLRSQSVQYDASLSAQADSQHLLTRWLETGRK